MYTVIYGCKLVKAVPLPWDPVFEAVVLTLWVWAPALALVIVIVGVAENL